MWLSIWANAAAQARELNVFGIGIIFFAGSYFISSAKEDLEDTRERIRCGKKTAYATFDEAAATAEKEWETLSSEKARFLARLQNVAVKLDIKS